MGKTVRVDERGRITLPVNVRDLLGARELVVEVVGNAVILRPARDRVRVVEEIEGIKLTGDRARCQVDAASVKHRYSGVKL